MDSGGTSTKPERTMEQVRRRGKAGSDAAAVGQPTKSGSAASEVPPKKEQPPIWWSNAIFFISIHVITVLAIPLNPPSAVDIMLCLASWQLATFGITVGYHRLWSHRAFVATKPLRIVLAGMGCLGFQGSIRWWVLRHRIHHRWTDTEEDPYDSSKGLFFSHVGWIFRRPRYAKMNLIERRDLDADPVVCFQHKYYIPLTLALGFYLPAFLAPVLSSVFPSLAQPIFSDSSSSILGQAGRGFLYGGLLARLMIWHFTFLINSFAHWCGEQAYSRDISARGNFILALFTGGEANHNYHHVFPKDYRNGPAVLDWDPTKWIIYLLHHYTPFVPKIYFADSDEIEAARQHVLRHGSHHHSASSGDEDGHSTAKGGFFAALANSQRASEEDEDDPRQYDSGYATSGRPSSSSDASSDIEDDLSKTSKPREGKASLPRWSHTALSDRVAELAATKGKPGRWPIVLVIDGYAVDATAFAEELDGHPGGVAILRRFAVPKVEEEKSAELVDATDAFYGGLNMHQWPARRRMRAMRVAKLV